MNVCETLINSYLVTLKQDFDCHAEGEFMVLTTPYSYPDGDTIELFIKSEGDKIKISDLGETIRRLALLDLDITKGKSRRALFAHIINSTGVSSKRGALYAVCTPPEVGERIIDLLDAVRQTSSLVFSLRSYPAKTFRDDVEAFLRARRFEPELNYSIEGDSGRSWKVHFYLNSRRNILIKALSATTKGGADYQVLATYAAYNDIKLRYKEMNRVAVLDDTFPVWDAEAQRLIQQITELKVFWSDREQLPLQLAEFGK